MELRVRSVHFFIILLASSTRLLRQGSLNEICNVRVAAGLL